jgi:hypothetical protein
MIKTALIMGISIVIYGLYSIYSDLNSNEVRAVNPSTLIIERTSDSCK